MPAISKSDSFTEIYISKERAKTHCPGEVCPAEVCSDKIRAAEVRCTKVQPEGVCAFKFASRRFALLRSAPKRSAPKRSTSRKFASRRSAPRRSGLILGLRRRHPFQMTVPRRNRARCLSSATGSRFPKFQMPQLKLQSIRFRPLTEL